MRVLLLIALTFVLTASCAADTLSVGPGQPFAKPCDAIGVAQPGDRIEIDAAGDYDGDVCQWRTNQLTLTGVGGRAKIDAAGRSAQGKAIWVIAGNDTIVENMEFTGCRVPDRNGAGIRQEGRNLTVRNCSFHDNEEGILAGDSPESTILVEYTEFANNGSDGYAHNIYINHVAQFTLQFSYSHRGYLGHLVKSRAATNFILYNRLTDETDGTGSYELDLPNGGISYVIGNLFQKGSQAQNRGMLGYRLEGPHPLNPVSRLFVVNNTLVNQRPAGATFIQIAPSFSEPVLIQNNIIYGPGILTTQETAMLASNFTDSDGDPMFVDLMNYDYHLNPDSPCLEAGTDPGKGLGFPLTPAFRYVHPAGGKPRIDGEPLNIGAY